MNQTTSYVDYEAGWTWSCHPDLSARPEASPRQHSDSEQSFPAVDKLRDLMQSLAQPESVIEYPTPTELARFGPADVGANAFSGLEQRTVGARIKTSKPAALARWLATACARATLSTVQRRQVLTGSSKGWRCPARTYLFHVCSDWCVDERSAVVNGRRVVYTPRFWWVITMIIRRLRI
jgi:hypothetical protein